MSLLSSWFRSILAFENGAVKKEFSIIDPTAAQANGLSTVVLAVSPSDGNSPTIVSLYFDGTGVKLFEKKYQDDTDAQTEMSAMVHDLEEAATLSKEQKVEEAKNLVTSLFDKYKRSSDPLVNEQPTPTMTQASQDAPLQYKGFKLEKLEDGRWQASQDVLAFRGDSIDVVKAKVDNMLRKAYGKKLAKSAGIILQNVFFDTPDEAMEYQEKMKKLQSPETGEEKPLWEQVGGEEQVAPSNETAPEEDNELAPPSLSFDRIEKDKAKQDKDIGKRIKEQVKTEVESALEQKSASVFGPDQEELVEALRKNGRNWDEIKKIFTKELSYNEDDTTVFLDSIRQKEEGGPAEGLPLPPKPPEDLVSPETHDKLVKEIEDKSEPKPEPLPLADEIARADNAEIRKVATNKVALQPWQSSSNYAGDDYSDYYVGPVKGYDADALAKSNYKVALEMLGGPSNEVLDGHFKSWAGDFDVILVHKDAKDKVAILQDIENKIKEYPVLNDEDFSDTEFAEQDESYKSWAREDALGILDAELHKQNPNLQDSISDLDLSDVEHLISRVVFENLSYGDGTGLYDEHLIEEAESEGLLKALRDKLEGKEVVPEDPRQQKLFETSLMQKRIIKALKKRALNPLQEPPAVGQTPGQPLAAPVEENPTFDAPVPAAPETTPEPEFLEAPQAGDRVYVMGDYETGQDGFEGTMVSEYTSKGDEYAVISKDDGDNAEVALHRVVKASQKKVAQVYYEKKANASCSLCFAEFPTPEMLSEHIKYYHRRGDVEEINKLTETPEKEAAKKCPKCGEDIWDVAGGGMTGAKLNKCWNCGTAFDSPEEEPIESEADLEVEGKANEDVIRMFISDSFPKDKMPVWGTANLKITKYPNGWALVNYRTPMLYRENGSDVVVFNTSKYSVTTSKIQNQIRRNFAGQPVKETDDAGIMQAIADSSDKTVPEPEVSPELQSLQESALKLQAELEHEGEIAIYFHKEGIEKQAASDSAFESNGWCRVWVDDLEIQSNEKYKGILTLPDENKRIEALKDLARDIAHEALMDAEKVSNKFGVQSWYEGLTPSRHDRIDWVALANPESENVESSQEPKIEKNSARENSAEKCNCGHIRFDHYLPNDMQDPSPAECEGSEACKCKYFKKAELVEKKADEPAPAPKEVPTQFKQLERAPAKTDRELAQPATEEQAKLVQDMQSSLSSLEAIKSIVAQAKAKLNEEIKNIEQSGGRVNLEAGLKEKMERLAKLVEATENQMINAGDTVVRLVQENKEKPFKPSDAWKVQKLVEKFAGAQEYLDKAIAGAQSLATTEQVRDLIFFPRKVSKLHKSAGFVETLDAVYNDVLEALKLIVGSDEPAVV